jgi:hypothetical protein
VIEQETIEETETEGIEKGIEGITIEVEMTM